MEIDEELPLFTNYTEWNNTLNTSSSNSTYCDGTDTGCSNMVYIFLSLTVAFYAIALLRKLYKCFPRSECNVNKRTRDRVELMANVISECNACKRIKRRVELMANLISERSGPIRTVTAYISVIMSAISFGLYFADVNWKIDWEHDWWTWVQYALSGVLSVNFVFKVLPSKRKFDLVFNWKSAATVTAALMIVFHLVYPHIGPVPAQVAKSPVATGLNFFRVVFVSNFADMISKSKCFNSESARERLYHLRHWSKILCLVVITTGFVHLFETVGDPVFLKSSFQGHSVSFCSCFLMIYGKLVFLDLSGINVSSKVGQTIVYGLQAAAMIKLGRYLQDLFLEIASKDSRWDNTRYTSHHKKRHVVLCGSVNGKIIKEFLLLANGNNNGHSASPTSAYSNVKANMNLVVLNEDLPDRTTKALLRQYEEQLFYLKGSVLDKEDNERADLKTAYCVIIRANGKAESLDSEDDRNISRVWAIKEFNSGTRVILEIIHVYKKVGVLLHSKWKSELGDTVFCASELHLGLIGKSCLTPGVSTLLSSYFSCFPHELPDKVFNSNKLYSTAFSSYFYGHTYFGAFLECYQAEGILLVSIRNEKEMPFINPHYDAERGVITAKTTGYFVAMSQTLVDKIASYSKKEQPIAERDIHFTRATEKVAIEDTRTSSSCEIRAKNQNTGDAKTTWVNPTTTWNNMGQPSVAVSVPNKKITVTRVIDQNLTFWEKLPEKKDSYFKWDHTGMFYWTSNREFKMMSPEELRNESEKWMEHIVICVMAKPHAQRIGLASIVLPLRSSAIKANELATVVILGNLDFLKQEWESLCNFQKLFIVEGDAVNLADIKAVKVLDCKMCIVIDSASSGSSNPLLTETRTRFAAQRIRAYGRTIPKHIPLLTYIGSEAAVIDDNTEAQENAIERPAIKGSYQEIALPRDRHYASGQLLTREALDNLFITCIFDPDKYHAFRSLILGSAAVELNLGRAEGIGGLSGSLETYTLPFSHHQANLAHTKPFKSKETTKVSEEYHILVTKFMIKKRKVVLGIFRKTSNAPKITTRFIISNPSKTFEVQRDDLLIVLEAPYYENARRELIKSFNTTGRCGERCTVQFPLSLIPFIHNEVEKPDIEGKAGIVTKVAVAVLDKLKGAFKDEPPAVLPLQLWTYISDLYEQNKSYCYSSLWKRMVEAEENPTSWFYLSLASWEPRNGGASVPDQSSNTSGRDVFNGCPCKEYRTTNLYAALKKLQLQPDFALGSNKCIYEAIKLAMGHLLTPEDFVKLEELQRSPFKPKNGCTDFEQTIDETTELLPDQSPGLRRSHKQIRIAFDEELFNEELTKLSSELELKVMIFHTNIHKDILHGVTSVGRNKTRRAVIVCVHYPDARYYFASMLYNGHVGESTATCSGSDVVDRS